MEIIEYFTWDWERETSCLKPFIQIYGSLFAIISIIVIPLLILIHDMVDHGLVILLGITVVCLVFTILCVIGCCMETFQNCKKSVIEYRLQESQEENRKLLTGIV